jgi:putative ATPase
MPEAAIPLGNAVVLVATSPKSNTGHDGIFAALQDVRNGNYGKIPRQLQNKHYDGEDAVVKGQHYLYPHDYPNRWVKQQYLPDALKNKKYYEFGDNKTEQTAKLYWDRIKGE